MISSEGWREELGQQPRPEEAVFGLEGSWTQVVMATEVQQSSAPFSPENPDEETFPRAACKSKGSYGPDPVKDGEDEGF